MGSSVVWFSVATTREGAGSGYGGIWLSARVQVWLPLLRC